MIPADRKEGYLKTANILAHLLFLVANIWTVTSPRDIYGDIQQTYFTPAIWVFCVWPVIHILLLSALIYSFASDRGKAVIIDGISWELPLYTLLCGMFVAFWANHYPTTAFVVSYCLNYVGDSIHSVVKAKYYPESLQEQFLILLPFTACQTWNLVIYLLTAFEAFGVDASEHGDGRWTRCFVVAAL